MRKEHHSQELEERLSRLQSEAEDLRLQADTALRYSEQVWWSWNLRRDRLKIRAVEDCILGYTDEDLNRKANFWWEKMHPDDLPGVRQSLEDCLDGTSRCWRCEHRLKDVMGDWVWVEQSGFVNHRDADDNPLEMVGTTRKIQERYQLMELFQGSEALLQALTENAPLHFWVRDQEGVILLQSRSMAQLLGNKKEVQPLEMVDAETQKRWQGRFHEVLQGKTVDAGIELQVTPGKALRFKHRMVPVVPYDGMQTLAVLELFMPVPD